MNLNAACVRACVPKGNSASTLHYCSIQCSSPMLRKARVSVLAKQLPGFSWEDLFFFLHLTLTCPAETHPHTGEHIYTLSWSSTSILWSFLVFVYDILVSSATDESRPRTWWTVQPKHHLRLQGLRVQRGPWPECQQASLDPAAVLTGDGGGPAGEWTPHGCPGSEEASTLDRVRHLHLPPEPRRHPSVAHAALMGGAGFSVVQVVLRRRSLQYQRGCFKRKYRVVCRTWQALSWGRETFLLPSFWPRTWLYVINLCLLKTRSRPGSLYFRSLDWVRLLLLTSALVQAS